MLRRVCQIVLFLLLLMAVVSPFMQLCSPDQFPSAGDDLETQIISGLSGIGIFLMLARILQLVAVTWRFRLPLPTQQMRLHATDDLNIEIAASPMLVPLRI